MEHLHSASARTLPPPPLALAMMWMAGMTSLPALARLKHDWRLWSPNLQSRAKALAAELENHNTEALSSALIGVVQQEWQQVLLGLEAYQRSYATPPLTTTAPPAKLLLKLGSMRLLEYGNGKGLPLLFIPSLINRATILDLMPGYSLLRYLAEQGFRPFLVEWDDPQMEEYAMGMEDYILMRLEPALKKVQAETHGQPLALAGYCMGGLLSLALAARNPGAFRALVLLSTPWDFHSPGFARFRTGTMEAALLERMLGSTPTLPPGLLQLVFSFLHPTLMQQKFRRYATLAKNEEEKALFFAIEHWVNNGIAMTSPIARTCLLEWAHHNATARGKWRVENEVINPVTLELPALVVVPKRDKIVSPCSALPLLGLLPNAERLSPLTGHVGMIAGTRARTEMWELLCRWLQA